MSSKPIASDFTRTKLPFLAGGALLIIYLATLNHWVSVRSLGMVAKVTGWDWTLPTQAPLFFALTYPIRFLPVNVEPIALNVFSALCAAATVGLLVRSLALLPQDRTEEQRLRQRDQTGLLVTRYAWAPAVLAAAVLGLELSMWENATAATGESLDVLVFAYLIRCVLEFRYSQNERWLFKLAFVYGLGVTNNWALIGFFPLFLGSVIWVRGKSFFNLKFIVKMTALGLTGMLLYVALPLVWTLKSPDATFWETLKSMLVTQKFLAFHPALRARALVLSLTSIVPVIIMGVKFPAGFGDVSSAGASITNFMFRAIHLLFAGVCIWVAFDQRFSPRQLAPGTPFLTFYYLGALAVGYYVGYLMVVFTEAPRKHWHPTSSFGKMMNPIVQGLAWAAVIAVPVALLAKNFRPAYAQNGKLVTEFVETLANQLPNKPAIVLADEAAPVQLLDGYLGRKGNNPYILIDTRMLAYPLYHRELVKRYGARWPNGGAIEDPKVRIDGVAIATALHALSTSNTIYYLHPSFGYFFEIFNAEPHGLVSELKVYPTNAVYAPVLDAQQVKANEDLWKANDGFAARAETFARQKLSDGVYVGGYLSRALNKWAVELRRANRLPDAGKDLEMALALNTNNLPAQVNLEDNRERAKGGKVEAGARKSAEDILGQYRTWDSILAENGPFDVPEYLYAQGNTFSQQMLVRQASQFYKRSSELDPTNSTPKLALIGSLIQGKWLDEAHAAIAEIQKATNTTSPAQKLDLISMEAAVYFGRHDTNRAEETLRDAMTRYPKAYGFYESLGELYRASGKWDKALDLLNREVSMFPSNTVLRMQRAEMAMNQGQTNVAIADLESIRKADPANTDAALFAAFIAIQQKDYPKGLKLVNEIIDRNEKNAAAYNYKGIILMEMKEDEKAIEALNKAIKFEPNNAAAVRNRAIVNLRAGHLKEAREDYELLQGAFPKSHQVYWGLGEVAMKRKDKDDAIKNYEMYLKYAPTNSTGEAEEERKSVEARLKELRGGK